MKARYQEGVFKPMEKIKDIKEGEVVEISLERHEWDKLAMANPSFEFLKNELDIYSGKDIIDILSNHKSLIFVRKLFHFYPRIVSCSLNH